MPQPDAKFNVPERHPAWPLFNKLMSNEGVEPARIKKAWKYITDGLMQEEALIKSGKDSKSKDRDSSNMWFNEHYMLLAAYLTKELDVRENTTLALWTGGYHISKHAQGQGHTTLENTIAGGVLQTLNEQGDDKRTSALTSEWAFQAPLWNAISRVFVQNVTNIVHVYMGTWDDNSVLMRAEIPTLEAIQSAFENYNAAHPGSSKNLTIVYHPIHCDNSGAFCEIGPKGTLLRPRQQANPPFTSRPAAVGALVKFLQGLMGKGQENRAAREVTRRLQGIPDVEAAFSRRLELPPGVRREVAVRS